MTTQNWKQETDDKGILWLCFDTADSNANVLSSDAMRELNEVLESLHEAEPKGLVIWSGKKRSFVMGADINEFTTIDSADRGYELVRMGQQVVDKVEKLSCPTLATVNGFCMGGGLELAMACDYRIVYNGDQKILGLPEVKLGLHPRFGGTVRAIQI